MGYACVYLNFWAAKRRIILSRTMIGVCPQVAEVIECTHREEQDRPNRESEHEPEKHRCAHFVAVD
jgi:hypothetical protein